jgi:CheY-like chemotaxis protein
MSTQSAPALLLYVEDEVLIQQMAAIALEEGGFAVEAVMTGDEAIAVLDARAGDFQALVTDIVMPGAADGWAVARHARELIPTLPVVYTSGDSAHEWASQGVPNSVMIQKPFAPAQIVVAVSTLINALPPA